KTGEIKISPAERSLCSKCGTALWLWDPRWPDLVHPLASAIDTELPIPPERTHLLLSSKAGWVEVSKGPEDKQFEHYPDESIAQWHQRLGLEK
ncbi:MAG: GFA family protein, partial [bacterium]|nr:GFA family protein [bacterium]